MIIATKELIGYKKDFKCDIVADIQNIKGFQKSISKIKNKNSFIEIYDLGVLLETEKKISSIKDHINKTGINPIIGSKKIEFKDISKLYSSKTGVVVECCGYNQIDKNKNSSYFLCVFSILSFYLGFNKISGFIVNKEH
tara:strand:- start:5031 stop:5447 length:417 start_codon:yes stop_codon:yes gene_type:complete